MRNGLGCATQPSAGIAEPRYLHYDPGRIRLHGMNHQLSKLRCLLSEAYFAGRLAVLPELTLDPKHNFGIANAWRWDTYFDFDSSRLTSRDGRERREHPLPIVRDLPVCARTTVTVPAGARLHGAAADAQLRGEVYPHSGDLAGRPGRGAPARTRVRYPTVGAGVVARARCGR